MIGKKALIERIMAAKSYCKNHKCTKRCPNAFERNGEQMCFFMVATTWQEEYGENVIEQALDRLMGNEAEHG